ncbi:hypothetical protein [Consotaella aegiceratis]|uniref:hypothetical protein n=1 Tax=Consotaella aegiceratis TaxID=3097961 RepID=UPI002F414A08
MTTENKHPVFLDLLALIMRSDEERITDIVLSLPMERRAALAAFCLPRCHLREIAFQIAAHCDARSLRLAAGLKAEILLDQAQTRADFDSDPAESRRKRVTLAHSAAA